MVDGAAQTISFTTLRRAVASGGRVGRPCSTKARRQSVLHCVAASVAVGGCCEACCPGVWLPLAACETPSSLPAAAAARRKRRERRRAVDSARAAGAPSTRTASLASALGSRVPATAPPPPPFDEAEEEADEDDASERDARECSEYSAYSSASDDEMLGSLTSESASTSTSRSRIGSDWYGSSRRREALLLLVMLHVIKGAIG